MGRGQDRRKINVYGVRPDVVTRQARGGREWNVLPACVRRAARRSCDDGDDAEKRRLGRRLGSPWRNGHSQRTGTPGSYGDRVARDDGGNRGRGEGKMLKPKVADWTRSMDFPHEPGCHQRPRARRARRCPRGNPTASDTRKLNDERSYPRSATCLLMMPRNRIRVNSSLQTN